jgi:DNA-binding transcriptional LysR family regulator
MIIDPLDGVAVFLAVAEHRSFTGAALALGVTPTAVSKAVRALETRQGVMLFQRTTRRVALTEAGEAVFLRLRPAVSEISDAFAALGGFRDRPMGTLRITAPHGAVEPILGALVPAFRRAYPEVTLEISLDEAIVDLVGAGFDAGIRLGEAVEKDMVAVRLTPEIAWSVVGAPRYFDGPESRDRPKVPEDLVRPGRLRGRGAGPGLRFGAGVAPRGGAGLARIVPAGLCSGRFGAVPVLSGALAVATEAAGVHRHGPRDGGAAGLNALPIRLRTGRLMRKTSYPNKQIFVWH